MSTNNHYISLPDTRAIKDNRSEIVPKMCPFEHCLPSGPPGPAGVGWPGPHRAPLLRGVRARDHQGHQGWWCGAGTSADLGRSMASVGCLSGGRPQTKGIQTGKQDVAVGIRRSPRCLNPNPAMIL